MPSSRWHRVRDNVILWHPVKALGVPTMSDSQKRTEMPLQKWEDGEGMHVVARGSHLCFPICKDMICIDAIGVWCPKAGHTLERFWSWDAAGLSSFNCSSCLLLTFLQHMWTSKSFRKKDFFLRASVVLGDSAKTEGIGKAWTGAVCYKSQGEMSVILLIFSLWRSRVQVRAAYRKRS